MFSSVLTISKTVKLIGKFLFSGIALNCHLALSTKVINPNLCTKDGLCDLRQTDSDKRPTNTNQKLKIFLLGSILKDF